MTVGTACAHTAESVSSQDIDVLLKIIAKPNSHVEATVSVARNEARARQCKQRYRQPARKRKPAAHKQMHATLPPSRFNVRG